MPHPKKNKAVLSKIATVDRGESLERRMGKKEVVPKVNDSKKDLSEDSFNQKRLFRITILIVVLLAISIIPTCFNLKLNHTVTSTSTNEPVTLAYTITPTATLTIMPPTVSSIILPPTSTLTSTSTSTPQINPSPIPEFHVDWHNESPDCRTELLITTKKIIGVEIFGGAPPYKITFRQYDKVIATRNFSATGKVEFTNSIVVDKGEKVYLTISFYQAKKELIWYGYLFYDQIDPECQR